MTSGMTMTETSLIRRMRCLEITGFPDLHLLNRSIQWMSGLGHKRTLFDYSKNVRYWGYSGHQYRYGVSLRGI
jgi:hypothetical protein